MANNNDDVMMIRIQAGDRAAFELLVAEWQPKLMRFFARNTRSVQVAEDLCQETFIRVYRKAANYLPNGQFGGWIRRLARWTMMDHFRSARREPVSRACQSHEEGHDLIEIAVCSQDSNDHLDIAETVRDMIGLLSDDQRQAVQMHYLSGMTIPEMSVLLNVPVPTLKSRLLGARQSMSRLRAVRELVDA